MTFASSILTDVQSLWLQLSIPITPCEKRSVRALFLYGTLLSPVAVNYCVVNSVWHLPVNATKLLFFLKVLHCLMFLLLCKFLYTLMLS